jgi:IMP dehydrogenase
MKIRAELGLTFDDVLLVPRHSRIASRSHVSTAANLTAGIKLQVPIVSANMDTVTESAMAIALARLGGIGFIHRFMSIERQAAEIAVVKRSEGFIVEKPLTIGPNLSHREAVAAMQESGIGGLIVVDEEKHVLGILSRRDLLLAPSDESGVAQFMTPRENLVTASPDVDLETAREILHNHRIEKLPLIDAEDRFVGLITAQDILKNERYPQATKDEKGRLRVGASIGARRSDLERAEASIEAGADVLVVDIAHGHSENSLEMIRWVKSQHPNIPLVGGNVASAEGVRALVEAGADAVKVGVGAGSICITRIVTGFGVPQLTAVMECSQAAHELGVPLIADGGLRNSGDIVKALAAGASTVMVGSLLAGTDEAPGAAVTRNGRRYKIVRGMASLTANIDRKVVEQGDEPAEAEWDKVVPEGVEAMVPHRGSVLETCRQLVGGLWSGMSYAGAETIEQLWERAEFIRITAAGARESGSHDVEML